MHKKCIAIVGIVRIVSDFWHNSGKLSDNSELREFSDRLVRVREGVKCVFLKCGAKMRGYMRVGARKKIKKARKNFPTEMRVIKKNCDV